MGDFYPDIPTAAEVGAIPSTSLDTDGTMAANSATRVPSQSAVVTYVTSATLGLLDYKGATDCSTNPNYPAALKGDTYLVSVAGRIGGASGTVANAGDWYVATVDNAGGTEAAVGTSWGHFEHNIISTSGTVLTTTASADLTMGYYGTAGGTEVAAPTSGQRVGMVWGWLTNTAMGWIPAAAMILACNEAGVVDDWIQASLRAT